MRKANDELDVVSGGGDRRNHGVPRLWENLVSVSRILSAHGKFNSGHEVLLPCKFSCVKTVGQTDQFVLVDFMVCCTVESDANLFYVDV